MSKSVEKELQKLKNPQKAKASAWFFKTGKGQYGEGDIFIGVTVPQQRSVAMMFLDLNLAEIKKLLASKIHEYRLTALMILVYKYQKSTENQKKEIYKFYISNKKFVNNWDLVDSSAHHIVGNYLIDHNKSILAKLAKSENIWDRRIAVVSTFQFIKNGNFKESLKIAKLLIDDKHDLIHKAVGWMLREIGKKNSKSLEDFLKKYHKIMPRTMLRYSIERLDKNKRKFYLDK